MRFALFSVLCFWVLNSLGAVQFQVEDAIGNRGDSFKAAVRVADFSDVQAFQFTLDWNPDHFDFVETGDFAVPGLSAGSFGHFPELGRLTAIWNSAAVAGESLEDGIVLFSLSFRAIGPNGASSAIDFADEPTPRFAVQSFVEASFQAVSGTLSIGSPPTISEVSDLSLLEDQRSVSRMFTIVDDATLPEDLVISFSSSNPALISTEGVFLSGTGENREFVIEPLPNQHGSSEIGIRVTDEGGATAEVFFVAVVESVNDPPTAVDDFLRLREDDDLTSIPVLVNDTVLPDAEETLALVSVSEGSAGGEIRLRETEILYRPSPNFFGVEEFAYVVEDGNGLTATGRVRVEVSAENDPPTARNDTVTVSEDSWENKIPVLTNDSAHPDEGETLSIESVTQGNFGGAVSIRESLAIYTPSPNFFGAEQFRYTIVDGNGGRAEALVNVEVQAINDPPTAANDQAIVPEDAAETWIDVLANDSVEPDRNESLSIATVGATSNGGKVRVFGGRIAYTPLPNFFGVENFPYTVSDGAGGLATAQVTVSVTNDQADAPVVRDDQFFVREDSADNVLAVLEDNGNGRDFDPDGDELALIQAGPQGSAGGRIQLDAEGRRILYNPRKNFSGEETFAYTVSDGERLASGRVSVSVANVDNDPPVALDDQFEVREDSSANALPVLGSQESGLDWDPEGLPVFVLEVDPQAGQGGRLQVSEDRKQVLYTPAANFSGEESFVYTISDGVFTAKGTGIVVVTPIPDAPSIESVSGIFEIDQDAVGAEFRIVVEDADTPASELVLEVESFNESLIDEKGIAVERSENGWTLGLTPRPGAFGRANLRLTASDGALTDEVEFDLVVRQIFVVEGAVLSGFLSDALVFFDANANGARDRNEPRKRTNRDGSFRFDLPAADFDRDGNGVLSMGDGQIGATGGRDFVTGKPMGFDLRAPLGVSLISPFSTLAALMLENGADDLQEAERLVRAKAGLSELLPPSTSLLEFHPLRAFENDEPRARMVLLRLLSLQSVVQQVGALVSGAIGRSPEEVAEAALMTIANTEWLVLPQCDRLPELLQSVAGEFGGTLPADWAAFGGRIIGDHVSRLENLSGLEGSFQEVLQEASRLQMAGKFGLEADLARISAVGSVSAQMRYDYEVSRYEESLRDYPTTDWPANPNEPGRIRFLQRSFCVSESGRNYEPVALVREGGRFGPLSVAVFFTGETARSPDDFAAEPVVVNFSDGEAYKELDFSEVLKDDALNEGGETMQLSLYSRSDSAPNQPPAPDDASVLKIVDDEFGGTFGFATSSFEVSENESAAVFVTRRGGDKGAVRLLASLQRGTGAFGAQPGVDFETDPVEVLFKPGELTQRARLPILPDFLVEENETILLRLALAPGQTPNADIGFPSTASVLIVNDDFNAAPQFEAVLAQTTNEDQELSVSISASDDLLSPAELSMKAASLNPELIVVSALEFDGETGRYRLLLRPQPDAYGESAVTVLAGDGFQETALQFPVTIRPVNDPPKLSEVSDWEVPPGETQTVPLEISDPDTALEDLVISAESSNPFVLPANQIRAVHQDGKWFLQFTPAARSGDTLLSLSVSDGEATATRTLTLSTPHPPQVIGPQEIEILEDGQAELILELHDPDTAPSDLVFAVSVDDPSLLPPTFLEINSTQNAVKILMRPAQNASGDAILTLQVFDGLQFARHPVAVRVDPVNDLPTISEIPNSEAESGSSLSIPFAVNDLETPLADLRIEVRVLHSNVPEAVTWELKGNSAEKILSAVFGPEAEGLARFEIVVTDADGGAASRSFHVFVRNLALGSETIQIADAGDGFIEVRWEGHGRLGVAEKVEGPYILLPNSTSPLRMRPQKSESYFKIVLSNPAPIPPAKRPVNG